MTRTAPLAATRLVIRFRAVSYRVELAAKPAFTSDIMANHLMHPALAALRRASA